MNSFNNEYLKINYGLIIFFFSALTLFIGFYYNEDGTGLALSGDFRDTLPYIIELKKDLLVDPTPWTLHFPLHYILFSIVDSFLNQTTLTRLFFCFLSISVPILFYKCLKIKFGNYYKSNYLILSSTIFFVPGFRYSAIWANDHITASISFLISIIFLLKWSKLPHALRQRRIIYVFYSTFFLALTCYSRQYYVIFFFIFFYIFYKNLTLYNFLKVLIFCFIISLPGFFILYKFPGLFKQLSFTVNIYNNIFGNFSALFVYTLPIFFFNFIKIKNNIVNSKKIFYTFFFSLFIFILLENKLDYENTLSLGAFFVISKNILGNFFLFYITVILGITFALLIVEYKIDFLVIFLIIFVFAGSVVIQKYFEPMFYFLFFLLMKTNYRKIFINESKSTILLFLSCVVYYFVAISDILYRIKITL
ncbi:hypothetical protein [Candidatus Fonsibacter ubiquis]|uniref:hypothetical protein n=1 Tax=Candidatus Fonsibacter ubiquis TaxID=1925548 RepID=UPI000C06E0E4|nr:hypothetical protein [Candidatus Fonsibacter ubiquis]